MSEPIRTFRDLIAWQRGMTLARLAYAFTTRLPKEELFGLTSQIRRAATSVPLNVAEGWGLGSTDQFLKHLRYARGSIMETDTAIELAASFHTLRVDDDLASIIAETDRVVQGSIRSLESKRT